MPVTVSISSVILFFASRSFSSESGLLLSGKQFPTDFQHSQTINIQETETFTKAKTGSDKNAAVTVCLTGSG